MSGHKGKQDNYKKQNQIDDGFFHEESDALKLLLIQRFTERFIRYRTKVRNKKANMSKS